MPILIDYNQHAIACAMAFREDMQKGQDTKKMLDIIRHVTLKSLITIKRNNKAKFGELVLCADGDKNWRRDVFPFYKQHRKKDREESAFDWETILSSVDQLRQDLVEVFPYKVVRDYKAEGDDAIATITRYLSENDMIVQGLYEEPQPILIQSSDDDFKQLHKYKNVVQWNMMKKVWVKNDNPNFLTEKIITGDSGDGVPSVLMEDDFIVNGVGRAKPVTVAVKEKFSNYEKLTLEEQARFDRNKRLIDFEHLPQDIYDRLVEAYKAEQPKKSLAGVMAYLNKHRCRELVERIEEF